MCIRDSYRPVAEIVFTKIKGIQKDSQTIDLESFIAVKGMKALGNQLTTDKLKQVNLLAPLPYEIPVDLVQDNLETTDEVGFFDENLSTDDDGQITLSLD